MMKNSVETHVLGDRRRGRMKQLYARSLWMQTTSATTTTVLLSRRFLFAIIFICITMGTTDHFFFFFCSLYASEHLKIRRNNNNNNSIVLRLRKSGSGSKRVYTWDARIFITVVERGSIIASAGRRTYYILVVYRIYTSLSRPYCDTRRRRDGVPSFFPLSFLPVIVRDHKNNWKTSKRILSSYRYANSTYYTIIILWHAPMVQIYSNVYYIFIFYNYK